MREQPVAADDSEVPAPPDDMVVRIRREIPRGWIGLDRIGYNAIRG